MRWRSYNQAIRLGNEWSRPKWRKLSKTASSSVISAVSSVIHGLPCVGHLPLRPKGVPRQKTGLSARFPLYGVAASWRRRGNSVYWHRSGQARLQRGLASAKGRRPRLSSPATHPGKSRRNSATPDELAQQIKLLLKDLGGSAKGCAIAVSDPESLLRIIEQPHHSHRSSAQRPSAQWPHGLEPGMQGFCPRLRAGHFP